MLARHPGHLTQQLPAGGQLAGHSQRTSQRHLQIEARADELAPIGHHRDGATQQPGGGRRGGEDGDIGRVPQDVDRTLVTVLGALFRVVRQQQPWSVAFTQVVSGTPVRAHTPAGTRVPVSGGTQQRMAKPQPAALRSQQIDRGQRVEHVSDGALVGFGHRADQPERRVRSGDRGGTQHRACRAVQAIQLGTKEVQHRVVGSFVGHARGVTQRGNRLVIDSDERAQISRIAATGPEQQTVTRFAGVGNKSGQLR